MTPGTVESRTLRGGNRTRRLPLTATPGRVGPLALELLAKGGVQNCHIHARPTSERSRPRSLGRSHNGSSPFRDAAGRVILRHKSVMVTHLGMSGKAHVEQGLPV